MLTTYLAVNSHNDNKTHGNWGVGGSICVGRGWGKRKKDTKNVREEEKHKEWERQRGLYIVMELIIRYHDDNILYTKDEGRGKK